MPLPPPASSQARAHAQASRRSISSERMVTDALRYDSFRAVHARSPLRSQRSQWSLLRFTTRLPHMPSPQITTDHRPQTSPEGHGAGENQSSAVALRLIFAEQNRECRLSRVERMWSLSPLSTRLAAVWEKTIARFARRPRVALPCEPWNLPSNVNNVG